MTIRKQWLIVLIIIGVFSVSVNAFVLSALTDKYFKTYMAESYNKHYAQIVDYSKTALIEGNYSPRQMAMELETHLIEPITRIKLYDANGNLIVNVGDDTSSMNNMMGNMMGRKGMRNYIDNIYEEVDNTKIYNGNTLIGQLNVIRYGTAENSIATMLFKSALISNSLISIGIVLIVTIIIGILISKRMSKDLINTALLAQNIDLGNETKLKPSSVKEIRVIQNSLETLKSKLMLKQKSRKKLVDELVHQTRTPLTILKTHLEGFEDGIIQMTTEEFKVCENQIENITAIISNMSGMIDAEKDDVSINTEEFDVSQLIKQIVNGLKVQFDKRNIALTVSGSKKIIMKTDKYKLSQVIYNILTNAYKFTQPNGKVEIKYELNNENISIIIQDNGIGISNEKQKYIFDAYYTDQSNNMSGEGIGLYVAKENIKAINGSIFVESKIGKGSKFVINIPVSM